MNSKVSALPIIVSGKFGLDNEISSGKNNSQAIIIYLISIYVISDP
jgi:hypothetical protein